MQVKSFAKKVTKAVVPSKIGRAIGSLFGLIDPCDCTKFATYSHDSLTTYGKSVEWMNEALFKAAYTAGMDSGHKIGRSAGSKDDIHIEWRAHICCWAAQHALLLEGDFVECGVNTGIMSLTICNMFDLPKHKRFFYLFDTFEGIPVDQMSESEKEKRINENQKLYESCYELTKLNFEKHKNAILVKGRVPETLSTVDIKKVSYLHLDMNIAFPEIAAANYFWSRLVPGAIIVLDDYGWLNHSEQRKAFDSFAIEKGIGIATLPTGQGLIIKPS